MFFSLCMTQCFGGVISSMRIWSSLRYASLICPAGNSSPYWNVLPSRGNHRWCYHRNCIVMFQSSSLSLFNKNNYQHTSGIYCNKHRELSTQWRLNLPEEKWTPGGMGDQPALRALMGRPYQKRGLAWAEAPEIKWWLLWLKNLEGDSPTKIATCYANFYLFGCIVLSHTSLRRCRVPEFSGSRQDLHGFAAAHKIW